MNLKDKMKSDSPEPKLIESEKEKNNSTSITQKSNPQSKELVLLEKQSEALRIVTEERDNLLRLGRPEDQEKIQSLSSEILSLKSAITEIKTELSQTQKINQSLVQNNDALRNSKGLMLRSEQKELQEKLTNAQALVVSNKKEAETREEQLIANYNQKLKAANERADEIEHRCSRDNNAAAIARKEAESFKDEHERILREQKNEVDKLAKQKISKTVATLKVSKENEVHQILNDCKSSIRKHKKYYTSEYAIKEMWHLLVFSFCIVWLVIQAVSSNYFRHEAVILGNWIKEYVVDNWGLVSLWSVSSANIANGICNEIVATMLYWILYAIVGLLSILLFYGVPVVFIIGGGFIYLKSELFDKANRWILIGSGIFFVAMSSEMFYTPKINLLLLWLLVQVAVPMIRFLIIPLLGNFFDKWNRMDSDERRNLGSNIMMIIIMVAGFIFILWSMKSCSEDLERITR